LGAENGDHRPGKVLFCNKALQKGRTYENPSRELFKKAKGDEKPEQLGPATASQENAESQNFGEASMDL